MTKRYQYSTQKTSNGEEYLIYDNEQNCFVATVYDYEVMLTLLTTLNK